MNAAADKQAECDYCGLPLPANSRPPSDEPHFCCYGCRFAAAVTQEQGAAGQAQWTLIRLGVAIFFTMNVMLFTLVLWTQDVYQPAAAESQAFAQPLEELFRYLCLVLALPVLFLLGGPLLESAFDDLRRRVLSTDLLLLLGVAAAYLYSAVSVVRGSGHVYFEVGSMILVAVTLGRWLEATGKLKTTEALRSLEDLLPDRVRVLRGSGEISIAAGELTVGDVVRVLPGERIAVDGCIVRNLAAIDEQAVTGESEPVIKEPGDHVFGGTLNLDGDLQIEATSTPGSSALERLIDAVVTAANRKERYGRLADRVTAWFIPAVLLVALGTFSMHVARGSLETALMACLAVVLIACPCALALATPMAIWAALGRASREGVVLHDGDALSRLAEARTVCFDKTGTLTTGRSEIEEFFTDGTTPPSDILRIAGELASSSTHSLSRAIADFAPPRETDGAMSDTRALAGRGVRGRLEESRETVLLGSFRLMQESSQQAEGDLQRAIDQALRDGRSLACVAWGGRIRGLFLTGEQFRPQVKAVLDWLGRQGYRRMILTGDHRQRAEVVGGLLGVETRAELLPEDKLAAINRLRSNEPLVMVGDGINDAPALAAADVGVAMGCGADASRQSADVCLLGSDLAKLPLSIELARRTVRTIRWNLLWAFSYNTVGIAFAATGWLNPIIAAAAMVASSMLVITNSMRLSYASETDAAMAAEFAQRPTERRTHPSPPALHRQTSTLAGEVN